MPPKADQPRTSALDRLRILRGLPLEKLLEQALALLRRQRRPLVCQNGARRQKSVELAAHVGRRRRGMSMEPFLCRTETLPPLERRAEHDLLPLRMKGRLLEVL